MVVSGEFAGWWQAAVPRTRKIPTIPMFGLIRDSLARAAKIRTIQNRRTKLPFRNNALSPRTEFLQSTALERTGLRERIWGEIPERQSTVIGPKSRRT